MQTMWVKNEKKIDEIKKFTIKNSFAFTIFFGLI